MPWGKDDAKQKTHKIEDDKDARQWRDVANEVLERTGDEGRAIREANGIIRKQNGAGVGGVPSPLARHEPLAEGDGT
jgi:hypothetical protein